MAVACRVLEVSTSGYYEWAKRPPSARDLADAYLLDTIIEVHTAARQTYGIRRVHAELTLTDVIAASTFSVFEALPDVEGLLDPRYCVDPRIADRADAWLMCAHPTPWLGPSAPRVIRLSPLLLSARSPMSLTRT